MRKEQPLSARLLTFVEGKGRPVSTSEMHGFLHRFISTPQAVAAGKTEVAWRRKKGRKLPQGGDLGYLLAQGKRRVAMEIWRSLRKRGKLRMVGPRLYVACRLKLYQPKVG
jgi:hypothetical protein